MVNMFKQNRSNFNKKFSIELVSSHKWFFILKIPKMNRISRKQRMEKKNRKHVWNVNGENERKFSTTDAFIWCWITELQTCSFHFDHNSIKSQRFFLPFLFFFTCNSLIEHCENHFMIAFCNFFSAHIVIKPPAECFLSVMWKHIETMPDISS